MFLQNIDSFGCSFVSGIIFAQSSALTYNLEKICKMHFFEGKKYKN